MAEKKEVNDSFGAYGVRKFAGVSGRQGSAKRKSKQERTGLGHFLANTARVPDKRKRWKVSERDHKLLAKKNANRWNSARLGRRIYVPLRV